MSTVTDPIADFLARVRNGTRAQRIEVFVPYSKIKAEIARILKDEGPESSWWDGFGDSLYIAWRFVGARSEEAKGRWRTASLRLVNFYVTNWK
jgi:ribosomal protein S8